MVIFVDASAMMPLQASASHCTTVCIGHTICILTMVYTYDFIHWTVCQYTYTRQAVDMHIKISRFTTHIMQGHVICRHTRHTIL